ncbi:MAG: hypothetical protein HYZ75_10025 [Elusimicrobia bacterium]|nr:hypothetical protein [Elusimicrobiota bacterium]
MAAGLLLAIFLVPASAADLPPCVRRTKQGVDEPRTLQGLLGCQEKSRGRYRAADDAAAEAFGEFQRAEVRDYLARHPERATTDSPETAKAPARPSWDQKGLTPEVAGQKRRSMEAVQNNAQRLPQADRAEYDTLGDQLWTQSGNGQLGVTPEMAQEIIGYLNKQQGGVSAEMADLLGSLQKDGPKLTHGSMRKLKKAARDAKSEGLDLGIEDESTETWLLDPETDPAPGEKDPSPNLN